MFSPTLQSQFQPELESGRKSSNVTSSLCLCWRESMLQALAWAAIEGPVDKQPGFDKLSYIIMHHILLLQVSIKTREGFVFKGVVRPPNEIVSMEGGDFFGDFVENVSLASHPVKTSACGGYGVNIVGKIFPKVKPSHFFSYL